MQDIPFPGDDDLRNSEDPAPATSADPNVESVFSFPIRQWPSFEHVFSFPFNWPSCGMCEFHCDPAPRYIGLQREHYFRLPKPWECPVCGIVVTWAMHGKGPYPYYSFSKETTLEFLATTERFARLLSGGGGR
jgi:hypothetical protein